jgi:hypothetical protein
MQPAIVAFAFGVLLFFASSAALALEPPLQGPGHLSLLMLATLAALTGLIAIAGAAPFRERRWGTIVGCATASVTASVVAVIVAMHLASKFPLAVPPSGAALLLAIARFAGAALLIQQAYNAFGVTSSKTSRDE